MYVNKKYIKEAFMKNNKYAIVERAVRWLIIMLMTEFVLGVLLTTVINYSPHSHSRLQLLVLILHIVLGVGLTIGSFAHILTSRSSHLLGIKPLIGFLCIVGALISGSIAAKTGTAAAVLIMALLFAVAIINYGVSYVTVKSASLN
jgi:hypothetical protein